MTNDEVIEALELTAKLSELHGENPFKVRALTNAAYKLSKIRFDFNNKTLSDIQDIDGIGGGIASKIFDLITHGSTKELDELKEKTPSGVIDMLGVKGLGPKKVKQLWQGLEIESIGELLYACNKNRLITLKGFGEKTQQGVKQSIEFLIANNNKFHFATIEKPVLNLLNQIKKDFPGIRIEAVGQLARKCEVIDKVEILVNQPINKNYSELVAQIPLPLNFYGSNNEKFAHKQLQLSSTEEHLKQINFSSLTTSNFKTEEEIYNALNLPFVCAELREGLGEVDLAKQNKLPKLIEYSDLRGTLHNHTNCSDGVNTLKEMADYCIKLGYEYFGVCDHSKTAVYASGLSIEKVIQQHIEIDELNLNYTNFKILKGIESDILGDGSLDYPEEILKTFDFIVASVHSNLKMNKEKATERLIKAIENPYTTILGHPTGRLLLARPGYPINHKKVIDACAANNVVIELNAHPYRLDIDWRWIYYCIQKNVMISINPDAHVAEGLLDMYYGICAARKGMLTKEMCLNTYSLNDLEKKFLQKK